MNFFRKSWYLFLSLVKFYFIYVRPTFVNFLLKFKRFIIVLKYRPRKFSNFLNLEKYIIFHNYEFLQKILIFISKSSKVLFHVCTIYLHEFPIKIQTLYHCAEIQNQENYSKWKTTVTARFYFNYLFYKSY